MCGYIDMLTKKFENFKKEGGITFFVLSGESVKKGGIKFSKVEEFRQKEGGNQDFLEKFTANLPRRTL